MHLKMHQPLVSSAGFGQKEKHVRFIDLATDGGCSQKASASELNGLLRATAKSSGDSSFEGLQKTFPDAGMYQIGGTTTLSTVDVLFPMVDDPIIFGRIVTNHVLNDIYASFGLPQFALSLLGVPKGLPANDAVIVQMLTAATLAIKEAGATVVGGHSLAHQESLFLGFAAVGTFKENVRATHSSSSVGDSILMTKRLGTSLASLRWRLEGVPLSAHQDVIDGMLQSAELVSQIASHHGVAHCTDISGFGFVNNLSILLARAGVGADIESDSIPIYDSVKPLLGPNAICTRQFYHNTEFSISRAIDFGKIKKSKEAALMDSQTSGGLLFICTPSAEKEMRAELTDSKIEVTKIGVTRPDLKIQFHT